MSGYFDKPFSAVLQESASGSPTPGGGSVSAMAASFGASMVSMVANLSTGEKFAEHQAEVGEILGGITGAMKTLERQVDEDMAVFGAFMDALRMPKETDEQKKVRTAAVQDAYKSATRTPLEIADTCLQSLELALRLAPIGNKTAISDVGVGAILADASLQGVLLAVDINLPGIRDEEFVREAAARRDRQLAESARLRDEAVTIVRSRL